MYQKLILVGRLGRDSEVKNEGSPLKFSMVTSKKYKNKEGDYIEDSEWHNVEHWGTPASRDFLVSVLKKGSLVFVEGSIKTNTWEDKEGNKKTAKKVEAFVITPLDMKKKGEAGDPGSAPGPVTPKNEEEEELPF
jgi:single-strand DNA-binding protein